MRGGYRLFLASSHNYPCYYLRLRYPRHECMDPGTFPSRALRSLPRDCKQMRGKGLKPAPVATSGVWSFSQPEGKKCRSEFTVQVIWAQ